MRRILALFLMILYTFTFSAEVAAASIDALSIPGKVLIKKRCKKQKALTAERAMPVKSVSSEENESVNFQLIHAICVTTTTPHLVGHSFDRIPYFDNRSVSEIPEAYNSPSLHRDPFPPQA